MIKVAFNDLKINTSDIESAIGYEPGKTPEHILEIINEAFDEMSVNEGLKAEYKTFQDFSFYNSTKSLKVNDSTFNIKSIILSQIKKSDEIALFICTAGKLTEDKRKEFIKVEDHLKGYIYDVVGSHTVEAVADYMQNELAESKKTSGLNISNRFSPGYCGWDVAEQQKLFSFFNNNSCGISLSGSSLMSPIKSVSGIIGIGKEIRFEPYKCKRCNDKNCIYRKNIKGIR